MSVTFADRVLKTSTVLTTSEALYVLRSHGLEVSEDFGADSSISVYCDGSHAFDYDETHPTIRASIVRSVLNDHEV